MSDSGSWQDLADAVDHASKVVLDNPRLDTTLDALEGVRYLTRVLATGALFEVENQNPAYPAFSRMVTPWRQWGLPNPDYVYLNAPVHGDYSYRIFGQRGTAHMLAFDTYAGRSANGNTPLVDHIVHVIDGSGELSIEPDGEFEITVSREKRDGNWLEIPEGEAILSIRNAFYDWESEEPAMMYIEREGATYPAPAFGEEDLAYRIDRLVEFMREFPTWMSRAVDQAYAAETGTVHFARLNFGTDTETGFGEQLYGQGVYHCEADEAVIMEVTPPNCAYWGFHLASKNWEGFDWDLRQTSINGHQAVMDPDGAFRAVIAHQDPGVPNWLDAGNHTTGLIAGRYNRFDSAPIPHLTVVPLAEVRDHLHPDTAVVTPAERSANLRRRMLATRRIHGW